MAIVWEAEFVTEEWWHERPQLLISGRGFRRLMEPGDSIPMGRGRLNFISEDGKLFLERKTVSSRGGWKLCLHTAGRYKVGSRRGHYVKPAELELDPLKKVLREMEIPIKALRPFEGDVKLELQTSVKTCSWHEGVHEGYFTDGFSTDDMAERYFDQAYTAKINDAKCVVVVREVSGPVWSQTEEHVVDWTRTTHDVVRILASNDCTPELLQATLHEANKSMPFRVTDLLYHWSLDVEVLTFNGPLYLDLDNDVFDVDFSTNRTGSRNQLVYTDGKDEVEGSEGLQDKHLVTDATVVIVLGVVSIPECNDLVEVEKIYLSHNGADLETVEQLLMKANQEHTFNDYRLQSVVG